MQREQRLKKELLRMSRHPPKGISVSQKDDSNINVLEASLLGPEDTPYE